MKALIATALLALSACATDIVAKGQMEGRGIFAANTDAQVLAVAGRGSMGLYQVNEQGQLRLTMPMLGSQNTVVVRRDGEVTTYPLSDPLPAELYDVFAALFTADELAGMGITFDGVELTE